MLAALAALAAHATGASGQVAPPPPPAAMSPGAAAIALLGLPSSPRMAALGGAYSGVAGDEGSVFVNPAGMAPLRPAVASVSWQRGLPGAQLSTAAFAVRKGRLSIGLGAMFLHLGGDSAVVPASTLGGTTAAAGGYGVLGVAALAYRRGVVSVGGSVKYVRQVADSGSAPASRASGFAGDVGVTIAIFDIMALGATLQNIGGPLSATDGGRQPLPRLARLGLTLNFVEPQGVFRLLTNTEYLAPARGDGYWVLAVESGAVVAGFGVLGRASYAAGRTGTDRRPTAFGGELRLRTVRLEYAFQGYRPAGRATHQVGLRFLP